MSSRSPDSATLSQEHYKGERARYMPARCPACGTYFKRADELWDVLHRAV